MFKKIDLKNIGDYIDLSVNEDDKVVKMEVKKGYKFMAGFNDDLAISVDGSMLFNYTDKLFLGSITEYHTLEMNMDELREECQRRYEEEMARYEELMRVSEDYHVTKQYVD